jgi:hypothetical protein
LKEYQKMAFRREPPTGCGEFDLRNGEEEEMGYEDLLSTMVICYLHRRGAAWQTPPSILISAGSSYKDHNFVRKDGRREGERQQFASNSATK